MELEKRIAQCLKAAVDNNEAAGLSVLVRKDGREVAFAIAGDAQKGVQPLRRDHMFRLFSQSKPITAAAVVLLAERGIIDLMDPVSKFLPGFRGQQVITPEGLVPAICWA